MKKDSFDLACFGEILWDLLPSGARPGGAPMNVAYHGQKLGMHSTLISRVGNDGWGDGLVTLLKNNSISTEFVQVDEEHATGGVNATIGANNEVSYDIIFPVAWDFITCNEETIELVQNASFFLYGSLAARNAPSHQTLLRFLEVAKTKVVDINLRPPHYTQALIEDLLLSADIVKLNELELALIAQWYKSLDAMNDQVKFLQDKFSIPTIIVTKGNDGALICKEETIFIHKGFPVTVADTVGSGDAFLAAFLSKTAEGKPVGECLKYANALGAFITSKPGACPIYDVDEIELLMKQPSVL